MTSLQIRNLFANTGHGSKGWTYSWGSAELLAKVLDKDYFLFCVNVLLLYLKVIFCKKLACIFLECFELCIVK